MPSVGISWGDHHEVFRTGFWPVPMSTAIVGFHTATGYLVAADGRSCNSDLTVSSDSVQKIFDISRITGPLAFSLTGNATIVDGSGNVAIDFAREVRELCRDLASQRSNSLAGFSTRIGRSLHGLLAAGKEKGVFSLPADIGGPDPRKSESDIVTVLFWGYWDGEPQQAALRLSQKSQVLGSPDISDQGAEFKTGSNLVDRAIRSDPEDELQDFSQYRPQPIPKEPTMGWCLDFAIKYISACASPQGARLDYKCRSIGGRIHVATITPTEGFQWVAEYAPIP